MFDYVELVYMSNRLHWSEHDRSIDGQQSIPELFPVISGRTAQLFGVLFTYRSMGTTMAVLHFLDAWVRFQFCFALSRLGLNRVLMFFAVASAAYL